MKNIIISASLLFCLYITTQSAIAESVDVFIPQREVTMNSSQMAKNLDNAARKFKESYSKKDNSSSEDDDSSSSNFGTFTKQIQVKQYKSDWT